MFRGRLSHVPVESHLPEAQAQLLFPNILQAPFPLAGGFWMSWVGTHGQAGDEVERLKAPVFPGNARPIQNLAQEHLGEAVISP